MSFDTNVLGAFIIGSLIAYMATDNQDKCNESRPQVRPVQPVQQRIQPVQQLAQRVQQPVQTRADAAAEQRLRAEAAAKAKADAEAAQKRKAEQEKERLRLEAEQERLRAEAAKADAAQKRKAEQEKERLRLEQTRKSASAPLQIIVKTDNVDFTIPYTDYGVTINGIDGITNRCLIISLAESMKIPVDKFYNEIITKFEDKIKEDDFKYPDSVDKDKIENQILGSEFIDVSNFLSLFEICLPAETGIILFSPADIETHIINLNKDTRNGYFKEPLNDKTIYIMNLGDEHFVVGDNNGQHSKMHDIIRELYTPIDTMQSTAPIKICDTINATDAREEEKEDEEVEKKNEDNEQAAAAKEQKRQEEAREQERLRAEAEAEQERLRAEAEAREQERLRAEAEQKRLRAEAAAEQKRLRAEAEAEQERLRAEREAQEQAEAAREAEKQEQIRAEAEQKRLRAEAEKQERLRAEAEQKRKAEEQERLREEAAKELLEKAKSEVNAAADAEQQTEEKIRIEAANGETKTKDNVVNQIMKIIYPGTTIPEDDYTYLKLIKIITSINHRIDDPYKIETKSYNKLSDVDNLETILYKVLDNYINFKSHATDNVTDNPSFPKFLTILQRLQTHNKLGGKTLRLRNRTKKTRKIKKNLKL